jgi:hypothetical protein
VSEREDGLSCKRERTASPVREDSIPCERERTAGRVVRGGEAIYQALQLGAPPGKGKPLIQL